MTTGVATVKLTVTWDAISSGGSLASTSWTLVAVDRVAAGSPGRQRRDVDELEDLRIIGRGERRFLAGEDRRLGAEGHGLAEGDLDRSVRRDVRRAIEWRRSRRRTGPRRPDQPGRSVRGSAMPQLDAASAFHVKSWYVEPVPVSRREFPTAPAPFSDHADVRARFAVRSTTRRRERPLVAEELDRSSIHATRAMPSGDPFWSPRKSSRTVPNPVLLIGNRPAQWRSVAYAAPPSPLYPTMVQPVRSVPAGPAISTVSPASVPVLS